MACNHFRVKFYDGTDFCSHCEATEPTLHVRWIGGGEIGNKQAFHDRTIAEAITKQTAANRKYESEHEGSVVEPIGERWV